MGKLPTKQDLKSVKGKEQDDVVMALTQAIGPDETIKLLEQCDMSKHAAKLVPNKKGNPDGPLPKWGEPEGVEDAMKKTPGQKKVAEGKDSEHSWKAEGHYTKDGKEWKGLQHVYKGQIMTGKTHTDESEPLYHFKQLEKDVQQKVHAKIQAEACWKGWKKRGMKKKGDRMVPNCVKEEVKTIKVGEDTVGSDNCHYALVMDRKVTAVGTKDEMLAKCKEEGGRVWVSTKKVGEVVEERSAQDPDIKDRKGTQPAAYHKGLKKTTKAKRDAHFKKHGKKADDDASAYKDAPGDKKARKGDMPKSKYTKFVDKMMDEEHSFHVRLDHLDGDARQKKAGDVLRKHEKAGHIKYDGETDKGVLFKAKSKSHADRLHKDLKPHATGVEHMNESIMSKVSEAKYAVDIEGMPRFYMNSDSPAKVKVALRQMLKKASAVKSVTRTYDTSIKADLRQRLKDASTDMHTNLVSESDEVHARFMRAHGKKASGHGRWAFTTSRHGQSQPGQTFVHTGHFGDAHRKAKKHFGKPVYVMEVLKKSDDMGTWVKDFQDSDAPQFKGKSMKKRRQMAIAAKLSAMREGTDAYGKSVNKMADDKKKAAMSSSDKNKLGKIAAMMAKERQMKKEEVDQMEEKRYKPPTATEIAADKKKDRRGKNRPSMTAKSVSNKIYKNYKEEVEQVDEARYKVPKNFAAMMAKKRKKAGTSEFGRHPDKKKAMQKESATFQHTVAKHLAKKDGHDYDRLPEYDRTHNKHKEHYNDQAKKKIAAGHFDKGIHETEIHFNADDKNNSRSAGAFVRHLSSKGIEAHKAGGSMHRSIVKVTSKDRAHHDYAKKKVAGRYDVNVRSEETKSWKKDSGWKKAPAERKDEYGNTIKKRNLAKHLARKAMKSMEKKS